MTKQDRNRKALHDLFETLNRGDFETFPSYFDTENFRYRNVATPARDNWEKWAPSPPAHYEAFNVRQEILEATAEGDNVWAYMVQTGKHTGTPWMGIPASGNDLRVEWFSIFRFNEDGKIVEIRSVADTLGMLSQIGALPPIQFSGTG
jgi:ketosteroid isomerase-like protein